MVGERAPALGGGCKHQWVMGESGACILPSGRSRREEGFGGSEGLVEAGRWGLPRLEEGK